MGAVVGALYASGYSGRELDSLARIVPLASLFRTYQPLAPRSLGLLQPLVLWEQDARGFAHPERVGPRGGGQRAVERRAAARQPHRAGRFRFAGHSLPRGRDRPRPPRAGRAQVGRSRAGSTRQRGRAAALRPRAARRQVPDRRRALGQHTGRRRPGRRRRARDRRGRDRAPARLASPRTRRCWSPTAWCSSSFSSPGPRSGRATCSFARASTDSPVSTSAAATSNACSRGEPRRPIRCCPGSGAPATHRRGSRPLPVRIARVTIAGANASEQLALRRLLGLGHGGGDTLDFSLLGRRVRDLAASSEAYESVWLTPSGTGDSVDLNLIVRRAARRVAGLGLAYDNELGGRMWAGVVDRRFLDLALEGSVALFLGELRRDLLLGLRRHFQVRRQLLNPTLTLRLGNEDVRRFDARGEELGQAFVREGSDLRGGGAARSREDGSWPSGADRPRVGRAGPRRPIDARRRGSGHRGQPAARTGDAGGGGMDRRVPPGRARRHASERGWEWCGWPLDSASAGARVFRYSSGSRSAATKGFPAITSASAAGSAKPWWASCSLSRCRDLCSPASSSRPAGPTPRSRRKFVDGGWTAGARIGLGAETPVGPVRFEYGLALRGRDALFVRLGRWF